MEKIYKKDDILETVIEDMSTDGLGVGKIDGYTLFVKDAVIGDTCIVKVMKAKKNYAYAHLEEVKNPSSFRITPLCKNAKACGGCQLQAMSYEAELKFKENKVENNLIRIGGFSKEFIESIKEPIVGMETPYRYRNKAQYPVGTDKNGKPVTGFYAGRTHSIIPNTDCLLGKERNKDILEAVLSFMEKKGIAAYDEESGKGIIRHILIREGFKTGEVMVCIIANADMIPYEEELGEMLFAMPGIKSVVLNINKENTNVILGNKTKVIKGEETIMDYLGDLSFKISAPSFFQVNPVQTEKLYTKALEYADLHGEESVWDLYCGIGTISLFMANKAKKVYGVEIVPEAIEDAKENAKRNGIENAEFFVGKAEEVLPEFYENETSDMRTPDVIVVDPPRKGCDEKCLETMLKMEPDRIVYVSCDSATLARDLKILCEEKYELKAWQCYDQFSRTVHVETVVLLSQLRQKPDDYIDVDVDVAELEGTSAETKATYEKIKKYVAEHNDGMKVSNLYIAQVKRKCGIELAENFNLPKSEESRQPQCPKEKEEAIIWALKAFKMI